MAWSQWNFLQVFAGPGKEYQFEFVRKIGKTNNKDVPKGTVFIQSSCGFVWPYPSLLYGRGNWAAVDMLFTMSDVPMTFMGEIEGESYRVEITNLYLNREVPKSTQMIKRAKSYISLDA